VQGQRLAARDPAGGGALTGGVDAPDGVEELTARADTRAGGTPRRDPAGRVVEGPHRVEHGPQVTTDTEEAGELGARRAAP